MPVEAVDQGGMRATRAIVDLDAIEGNVRALRSHLPATTRLMAVVKADGYGHGAPWVARVALEAGAALLGVATVGEGRTLRGHGIGAPIVILGAIDPSEAATACRLGLEITVADEWLLDAVQEAARWPGLAGPAPVHLKIDTGLRRYGALPDLAIALATRIRRDPCLRLASVFTHLASADEPDEPFTGEQIQRFAHAVEVIRQAGASAVPTHVANSAGILAGWSGDCAIARAGIALYGVPPSDEAPLLPGMRPAFSLESRIMRLVPIDAGDSVGYNRTFRANRPMTGALIPIGYADGYRRSLAGKGWVGICGQKAPLLGRVSMDQIVVAAPPGSPARTGDSVHIMGGDAAGSAPTIREMASLMETNTYETLVGFRRRIPRVFMRRGDIIDVTTEAESAPGA